jgi:hypothetical protein
LSDVRSLSRCAASKQSPHQNAEIEAGNVDQVPLVQVLASAQSCAAHAATVKDVGEASFNDLATFAHSPASDGRFQARPVGIHRLLRRLVATPTQDAIGRLRF